MVRNFDSQAVGKYLAEAVMKLEQFPNASLDEDVSRLLELRGDREHILDAARRTGHSYLNYATEELQQDRKLALEIVRICGNSAGFELPGYFKEDRELVMEALSRNGCIYRQLDDDNPLKADRKIIMTAFQETPERRFHEHLPDLIPMSAFVFSSDGEGSVLDSVFVMVLVAKCPSLHLNRAPWLLQDKDVTLKWCEVGRWFPHSVSDLPQKYGFDLDVQDVLVRRFEGTEKYDTLVKKFEEKGVCLRRGVPDELIEDAKGRVKESGAESFSRDEKGLY